VPARETVATQVSKQAIKTGSMFTGSVATVAVTACLLCFLQRAVSLANQNQRQLVDIDLDAQSAEVPLQDAEQAATRRAISTWC
jgi:hypothetical protein